MKYNLPFNDLSDESQIKLQRIYQFYGDEGMEIIRDLNNIAFEYYENELPACKNADEAFEHNIILEMIVSLIEVGYNKRSYKGDIDPEISQFRLTPPLKEQALSIVKIIQIYLTSTCNQ